VCHGELDLIEGAVLWGCHGGLLYQSRRPKSIQP
jgi:hypothetical protein